MVEAGWTVVAPILDLVEGSPGAVLREYPSFNWGPAEADALLAHDGRAWSPPEP
jgi:glucose-6-phosphate 1-dehydrogenase